MPLDPSTRDRISLSAHKHRPVFCCCFDSGTREITLWIQKGAFPHTETYKQRSILDSKSDLPCTRIVTTSSLGLQCNQKHDLLLWVVYSFNHIVPSRLVVGEGEICQIISLDDCENLTCFHNEDKCAGKL